jgi:hypothetical protein
MRAKDIRILSPTFIEFYNQERPHQSLDWHTPAERYFGGGKKTLTGGECCLNQAALLSS